MRIAVLVVAFSVASCVSAMAAPSLTDEFASPPDSAKPWVYWWWLNGNVTPQGITADLEAMKRQGINGVLIFNAGGGAGPVGPAFLSPEWRALFRHALREAKRLSMEVSVNLCDGWDAGGPWISPDQANKKLVCAEMQVDGPATVDRTMPMPPVVDGYYKDVAVVAFPVRRDQPATPATVEASSSQSGYCAERNFPPEDAVDGDTNTYWASAAVQPTPDAPAWLTLTYPDAVSVFGAFIAAGERNGPRDCELQAAVGGAAFGTVTRFTLDEGGARRLRFDSVRGDRFRLLIRSAHGSPVQVAELELLRDGDAPRPRPGIQWWWFKSGNRSFWDYPRQGPGVLAEEYPDVDGARDCRSSDVQDLAGRMTGEGRLRWQAPPGRWAILRFGYTLLGQQTRCSTTAANGYEADMLDARGIEAHFRSAATPLLEDAAAVGQGAIRYLHIDSYELGADVQGRQPTFSTDFRREFARRRGYDLLPYLPVLARRIVDSREVSDRFLFDYRWTIGDLMAERFFGRFAELAHANGVGAHSETGYGTYPYPHIDGLRCAGMNDVTMGEFWHGTDIMSQFDHFGNVIRSVASAAHIYGRPLVQAEAFTSWSHFAESPRLLKPDADRAFCDGLNRAVIHQYTAQPDSVDMPGLQYGAGTHVDRKLTWWEQGRAFFDYLARCQRLLQEGTFVADACYFYGEGATRFVPSREFLSPPLPPGYDFDAVNADVLLRDMVVRDGRLVLPSGVTYRVLVLPEDGTMSPAVLRKVRDLVADGATVIGSPPVRAPGLTGYPGCDNAVRRIADDLWGRRARAGDRGERNFGKGRVVFGKPPGDVLLGQGVGPDFAYSCRLPERAGLDGAMWVWHAADGDRPPAGVRVFRTELAVPDDLPILSARISITADNAFSLSANGLSVCSGHDWTEVEDADLAPYLHAGRNTLTVRATNTVPGPAGVIAKVVVRPEGGAPLVIATGPWGWRSHAGDYHWAPTAALGHYGMAPWGRTDGGKEPRLLGYVHRRSDEADVYFVANRRLRAESDVACTFRVRGRMPEIWDPLTGESREAAAYSQGEGGTTLPLDFGPYGSLFIVFRRPIARDAEGVAPRNFPQVRPLCEVTGPWAVRFDPKWGGPGPVSFDRLVSWPERPEDGVRHYSGTATYTAEFDVPGGRPGQGQHLFLDLGEVRELARVRLNGVDLGVVWTPPFRVDITDAARPAANRLEVEVVNLWPNRLIGDAALPEAARFTQTNVAYAPSTPLFESGLLGPVQILASR